MKRLLDKKILGILISIVFIAIIVSEIDINRTIESFSLINPVYLLPAIPCYLLSFAVRAFRWRAILNNRDLPYSSLLSSIFIGFSLNCVLPARAGEIYRAYFFSRKESLSKAEVFTSVFLERIFDGVMLFIVLVAVICLLQPDSTFLKIAVSAGFIFLGTFTALLALVRLKKSGRKREKIRLFLERITGGYKKPFIRLFSVINSIFDGLGTLNSVKLLINIFLKTYFVWLLEALFMFFVIKSFGIGIDLTQAFLVLCVTAFSSLIPAGPAAIGPYQWGYILALGVCNVKPELALAVSIVNQLLMILIILSTTLLFVWKDRNLNYSRDF